jgi:type IV pilus assembly protein PilY1
MKNNKDKKQSLKNSLKNSQTRKIVSLGFSFSYLLMISLNTNASDIEIYRQGSSGANSTIMLMVDTSQTMGSPALDILKIIRFVLAGRFLVYWVHYQLLM